MQKLNEYQEQALKTLNVSEPFVFNYLGFGLASEAGEVAGKIKKMIRDDGNVLTENRRNAIADELCDVLWYVATLSHHIGFSLSEIADRNILKLKDRFDRGVICGDGDKR